MAHCEIEMVKAFGYDWAFFPLDSAVALEPLGIEAGPKSGGKGIIPWTPSTTLPATDSTLKSLKIPDPQKDGRMPLRLEAIGKARAEFGNTKCVTGFVIAPFSSVCYLYGVATALLLLIDKPQFFLETLDFFTEFQLIDAKSQLEAGAHALLIADLFASSSFISVEYFYQFSFKSLKRLVQEFTNAGAVIFYHPNESRIDHLISMSQLRECGNIALTVGTDGNIFRAKRAIGDKICLMGSYDPIGVLRNGTSESVEKATKLLIQKVGKEGGYIFYSGGTVAVDTPVENVKSMMRAARKYWD
jgi:uroporphyrinogen decarboxylase